jgi:hypothetical protein
MVKQITAYQASDATTFSTYEEAVRHDAELVLLLIFDGNVGIINKVLDNAEKISEALAPMLVEHHETTSSFMNR